MICSNCGHHNKPIRVQGEADTIDLIVNTVLDYYGQPKGRVFSKNREDKYRIPRQMVQTMLDSFTKLSLREIAEICGQKSHTTVINSKQIINDLRTTDEDIAFDFYTILSKINETIYVKGLSKKNFKRGNCVAA